MRRRRDEFSKRKRQINDIDYEKSKLNIELQRDTIKLQESTMILEQVETEYVRKMGATQQPMVIERGGRSSSRTLIEKSTVRPRQGSSYREALDNFAGGGGSAFDPADTLDVTVTSQSLGGRGALH